METILMKNYAELWLFVKHSAHWSFISRF